LRLGLECAEAGAATAAGRCRYVPGGRALCLWRWPAAFAVGLSDLLQRASLGGADAATAVGVGGWAALASWCGSSPVGRVDAGRFPHGSAVGYRLPRSRGSSDGASQAAGGARWLLASRSGYRVTALRSTDDQLAATGRLTLFRPSLTHPSQLQLRDPQPDRRRRNRHASNGYRQAKGRHLHHDTPPEPRSLPLTRARLTPAPAWPTPHILRPGIPALGPNAIAAGEGARFPADPRTSIPTRTTARSSGHSQQPPPPQNARDRSPDPEDA
jgi:hypothetical protein